MERTILVGYTLQPAALQLRKRKTEKITQQLAESNDSSISAFVFRGLKSSENKEENNNATR